MQKLTKEISDGCLKLVDVKEKNIEQIRLWRNSKEVASYMFSEKEITPEEQKKWYDRIKKDTHCKYWIIEYKNPIGVAYLTGINTTLNSCYFGFYLGDTSLRGVGIGSIVQYTVLNYVFETLELNKLRCEVFEFNDKALRLYEKFGFRREAFYREHCHKNGSFQNVIGLALLKSEWKMIKNNLYSRIYKKNNKG